MLSHYSPAKSICQRSFCDQSANLFAYKCTALTLIVLNVVVSLCFNIQCLFVYGWLSAVLLLSTTTGPSLTLGCTISVGISCVCVSVWVCDIHQVHQQRPPSGPVSTKTIRRRPSERCTWVCFFSLHSHNEEAWCVRLPRHNGMRITVCEPRTVALKKKYISHSLLPAFLAPSRWLTPHTPTAACAGGVCAHVREDVCALHVCVCVRGWGAERIRAAEIIHFVRRQDKCRESRFSHFLLPCLSLVLFLGPVFCIVVIRPTACESVSTQ